MKIISFRVLHNEENTQYICTTTDDIYKPEDMNKYLVGKTITKIVSKISMDGTVLWFTVK